MNAKEARELAQRAVSGEAIQPFMAEIYEVIKDRAKEGHTSINHIFYYVKRIPPVHLQEAIYNQLRYDGYVLKYHENDDPGDPRSTSYTSISW